MSFVSVYEYGLRGSVRNVLVKVQKGVKQAKALAGAEAGAEAGAKARARVLPGRAFSYFVFKFLLLYLDTVNAHSFAYVLLIIMV